MEVGDCRNAARILFIIPQFALLGEVFTKLDQNVPNLLRRNVRLIQLGINRHKNYVFRCLEVVDQTIARTFAFLDIAIANAYLEYSIARPWHLITHNLTCLKLANHG